MDLLTLQRMKGKVDSWFLNTAFVTVFSCEIDVANCKFTIYSKNESRTYLIKGHFVPLFSSLHLQKWDRTFMF